MDVSLCCTGIGWVDWVLPVKSPFSLKSAKHVDFLSDFAFVPSELLPDLFEWLSEDATSMWLPRWIIMPPNLKPKGCGLMTGEAKVCRSCSLTIVTELAHDMGKWSLPSSSLSNSLSKSYDSS